jgi:hypothetical protein
MKNYFSSLRFKLINDKDKGKWIPSVRRDWTIIARFVFATTVLFVASHLFLFSLMRTEGYFSSMDLGTNGVLDKVRQKDLDDVLAIFQKKKENFDSFAKNPVLFSDPSKERRFTPEKNAAVPISTKVDLSN